MVIPTERAYVRTIADVGDTQNVQTATHSWVRGGDRGVSAAVGLACAAASR